MRLWRLQRPRHHQRVDPTPLRAWCNSRAAAPSPQSPPIRTAPAPRYSPHSPPERPAARRAAAPDRRTAPGVSRPSPKPAAFRRDGQRQHLCLSGHGTAQNKGRIALDQQKHQGVIVIQREFRRSPGRGVAKHRCAARPAPRASWQNNRRAGWMAAPHPPRADKTAQAMGRDRRAPPQSARSPRPMASLRAGPANRCPSPSPGREPPARPAGAIRAVPGPSSPKVCT